MKSTRRLAIVLVTAPDLKTARRLARGALRAKRVACANLIPRLESHYRWKGRLEKSPEVLILFKAPRTQVASLEKFILAEHPYDTPEFVVMPISAGNGRYLDWIVDSTR